MCWYRRRAGVCAVVSSRSIVERPARDARAPVLASRIVAKDFFESTHLRVFVGRVDGDGRATSDARPRTRLVASILVASASLTRCSRIARAPSRRVRTRASFFPLRASEAPPRRGDSRARRGVPRPPVARRVSGASTRNDVSRTRDALERHCVTRDRIDFGDDVEADWCLSIERCVPLDARVRRRVRRARRGRRRTVRRQSLGKALEGAIDARFERRAREFVPRGAGKRAFCMIVIDSL